MKKTVCVLLTLLSAALFCACGGRETAVVSNANASMMIPDSNIVEGGTFSAKAKEDSSAVDGVKVEPIAYQEDGKYWFLYLLATNESGEVLHLSADVIFYDSDGKQISKDYSNAIAVDNGITTALDFMCNEQFASYEYTIETFVPAEEYTLFGVYMPLVFLAAGNLVFFLYDIVLTRFVMLYVQKLRSRVFGAFR